MVVGDRNTSDFCGYFPGAWNCSTSPGKVWSYNTSSTSVVSGVSSFIVDDIPAGSKQCIAVAFFPADSGADYTMDTDYRDENGVSHWAISAPKCYTVAKKPSIQVWGGNVYSGGTIKTGLSEKRYVSGYGSGSYNAWATGGNSYLFGSFGELGVISFGAVSNFGSGASLGYSARDGETLKPNPSWNGNSPSDKIGDHPGGYYGSTTNKICKISPLSIANQKCVNNTTGTTGTVGTNNAMGGVIEDKDKIMSLVNALGVGNAVMVSEINDLGNGTTYYESSSDNNGDITISGGTIPNSQTILIHAKGNIKIDGDITYNDTGYTNLTNTPKLIIYSDNNINVSCNVTRIDAVLMAKIVDTCPTENGNHDSANNARQLTVYGAIIANKLEANRTYGAANGNNSIVPAEIIDFDATLYLWKGLNDANDDGAEDSEDDGGDDGVIDVVYLRELAPRY